MTTELRKWIRLVEQHLLARLSAVQLLHTLENAGGAVAADDIPAEVMKFTQYVLRVLPVSAMHCHWQPRNPDNVVLYAERMRRGETFPPVVYDLVADTMIDGCHRLKAAKLAGLKTLPAYVGSEEYLDPEWEDI